MGTKQARLDLGMMLLIFALGFVAYSNTLQGPFLFDDYDNIVLNGHLRIHDLWPSTLADAAFHSFMPSRPVANLSFALNYLAHGFWLPGFHLTNIAIHCLTGLFLYVILKMTLATPPLRRQLPPESVVPIAGLSTLLWLLNPQNTQSVSYLVQRMNSLAALFFLLSLLLYLKGRTVATRRPLYFTGCLLSGILALGTKEIAATLLPIIFLYEWYFFQDLDRNWLKRKLPWLGVVAIALLVIAWFYLRRDFTSFLAGYQGRDFTIGQRLLTEARVVCRYLGLIFFPYPGLLNLDYDYPISTGLLNPPTTIFAIAALTILFLAAILSAPRQRLLSFSILWFMVNLLIESTIIPLEIIFEHRTYLPAMLVWPPILAGAWQLPTHPRKFALPAVLALLAIFATWTWQRNQVWANEVAINRDIAEKSPNKARAHCNLGRALLYSSQEEAGRRELEYAITLDPGYGFSYLNLGGYYLKKHLYDQAIANFTMASRLMPSYDKVSFYLSEAYFENKQYPEAIASARKAMAIPAYREKALIYLGIASSETGDLETAISSFGELAQNNPRNSRYRFNWGHALETAGQRAQALQKYEEALALASDDDKKIIQQARDALRKNLPAGGSF